MLLGWVGKTESGVIYIKVGSRVGPIAQYIHSSSFLSRGSRHKSCARLHHIVIYLNYRKDEIRDFCGAGSNGYG